MDKTKQKELTIKVPKDVTAIRIEIDQDPKSESLGTSKLKKICD